MRRCQQQIALRKLIGDVKRAIAELAAAGVYFRSAASFFWTRLQLGKLLAVIKERIAHGKWMNAQQTPVSMYNSFCHLPSYQPSCCGAWGQ